VKSISLCSSGPRMAIPEIVPSAAHRGALDRRSGFRGLNKNLSPHRLERLSASFTPDSATIPSLQRLTPAPKSCSARPQTAIRSKSSWPSSAISSQVHREAGRPTSSLAALLRPERSGFSSFLNSIPKSRATARQLTPPGSIKSRSGSPRSSETSAYAALLLRPKALGGPS
jgi:hypothetical protein